MKRSFLSILPCLILAACAAAPPPIPVDRGSAVPGQTITRGGHPLQLQGQPIAVGDALPEVILVDSRMKAVNLADLKGEVLLVSIVPSLDTRVCERQTHLLGEAGQELPATVRRITISRDLPFAQTRFAEDTGMDNILYLSDYRDSRFGRATGLLVDDFMLLARAVMVVDREGIIRYLQVVPEMGHLPDFDTAFDRARLLAQKEK